MPSIRFAALATCLAAALSWPPSPAAADLPLIDAHSQVDHKVDLQKVIRLMDKAGVRHTILSTRGRATPQQLTAFAGRHTGRITPSVRTKGGAYAKGSRKYYDRLNEQLAMPEFGAMAEVIMWHAQKGSKAQQVIVPPDDKRVQTALQAALGRKWPFVVHIEFAAAGADRGPFMAKFEDMVKAHPDHPFLLIHMGQLEPPEAARLIEAYANVHFITSHSNPVTVESSNQPWVNLFDGERLSAPWRALVVRHPDRFVLGFDNVFAEHWGRYYLDQVALWKKALADLPDAVAHAVAHGNAERLWHLPPAR